MFGRVEGYIKGDFNVICDRSGFKCKASDTRLEWNGLRVYKGFWEPRQPQDKIRAFKDKQAVRNPRPDSTPIFVGVNEVQPEDL